VACNAARRHLGKTLVTRENFFLLTSITYYLMRLPTLEKKVRLAIDWTLDQFFARDTVRLALEEAGSDPRFSVGGDSASRRLE
jgi:hypothetical protein